LLWSRLQKLPNVLRRAAAPPLSHVPSGVWSSISDFLPGQRQPHLGSKIQKALRVAGSARSLDDVYHSFLDEWSLEESPVINGGENVAGFDFDLSDDAPDVVRMMYCDAMSYLPDDILCKVDRASMAVSLEARVPFLDHRVAELAARIPLSMKVRDGKGKHILRELLYREAPRPLFDRPKAGFAIPVGQWIKGSLRPWAEELLDKRAMAADGFFNPDIVHRRWQDHLSGRRDSTPALWAVLMFQAWRLQEAEDRRGAA
jgi:asparagine synthase (glutamine-hydrolysing)